MSWKRRAIITKMNIDQVTRRLGEVYRNWKDSEKEKNKLREEFFELASQSFDDNTRATKVVHVGKIGTYDAAREYAIHKNPFWTVTEIHLEEDEYFVRMEEDFTLKPFAFVNQEDGMVYQRTVVEGEVLLDDERMKVEDPELWKEITVEKVVEEILPFEELRPETLDKLSEYLYQGKPTVKFLAPRAAREDELERE